jgi:hypothetical protein
MTKEALVVTTLMGFGDCLYMTPFVHFLKQVGYSVDVWAINPEPFQNNPDISTLKEIKDKRVTIPSNYSAHWIFQKFDNNGSNLHTVDHFTLKAFNFILRAKEKDLVFRYSPDDMSYCESLLKKNDLISNKYSMCNFVVMCPAVTWPSRTLPLKFYQELAAKIQANGDKVVLVGKTVALAPTALTNSDLALKESKGLYPVNSFPNAIDLTNQLTLHQLAALYDLGKMAINSENGNMVISCTSNKCWNLYLPTLTAPEYRLPYRKGSQQYRTLVISNPDDYYYPSDYSLISKGSLNLSHAPVLIPKVEDVYGAYLKINKAFLSQANYI